jgi:hypothetical protein
MSAITSATVATLIGTGVAGATSIAAMRSASGSNRKATDAQARAEAQALELDKEQLAEEKRQFDNQQKLAKEAFDAEQDRLERDTTLENARWKSGEARATRGENVDRYRYNQNAPYRATGRAALGSLADLAGLKVGAGDTLPMVPGEEAPPYPTDAEIDAQIETSRRSVRNETMPEPGGDGLIEVRMPVEDFRALNDDLPSSTPIVKRRGRSLAELGTMKIANRKGKAA